MGTEGMQLVKTIFTYMCADYDAGILSHEREITYRRILSNIGGCEVQTISEFSWEDYTEDVFYFVLIDQKTRKEVSSYKAVR